MKNLVFVKCNDLQSKYIRLSGKGFDFENKNVFYEELGV